MKDTSLQHMTHQSQCTVYITVHNCTIFLEQNGVQECMLIVVLLVCSYSVCVCICVCVYVVCAEGKMEKNSARQLKLQAHEI